jgi:DNA-binding response OmpR family regulator
MQSRPRILSISYDGALLSTRQTLLELQGYAVVSAEGFTNALRQCKNGSFDLVIIGHSIPHNDKEALIAEVRQSCGAPVLALLRSNEEPLEGAAASIDPMDTKRFLEAVQALTTNDRTAA